MKKLFALLFCLPLFVLAQEAGIKFDHSPTWTAVVEKAKSENKHIFVDCFTTWCGPCKYMSANIFPQQEVGDFFNPNFVSVKLQMDQTEGDSDEVKSWYDEAKRFATDYKVVAYPTFLIFNPEGELVHRIVGGGEAEQFIASAKEGLNPETQYVTLQNKYKANPTDKETVKALAAAARKAYDTPTQQETEAKFLELATDEELLAKENFDFLKGAVQSTDSKAFTFIRNNKEQFDKNNGEGAASSVMSDAILRSHVLAKLQSGDDNIDWTKIETDIATDFPEVDIRSQLAMLKAQYSLYQKRDWTAFREAVDQYVSLTGEKINPAALNSFAWAVFEGCNDEDCLKSALEWSKASFANNESPEFLDTYANLLYKSGDAENAIKWSEKALELASEDQKSDYMAVLAKMKAGVPTWSTEE